MRCRVNFLEGRESTYNLNPVKNTKNVVVIGGGAAGMEAARTACLLGHNVTIVEKVQNLEI